MKTWPWALFFVINTLQDLSGVALPCACSLRQERTVLRGPEVNPAGGRGSDVSPAATPCYHTQHLAHALPGRPLAVPPARAPGPQPPGCPPLLIEDDSFMGDWKLDFWKHSIYLKENRSYLSPPVKYDGNMSANNLLCVICSNANRQQLGHFLW